MLPEGGPVAPRSCRIAADEFTRRPASGRAGGAHGADMRADKIGEIGCHFYPEDVVSGAAQPTHRALDPRRENIVRHVGDRVAVIIAEAAEIARDAAELVDVQYEALPSVVNVQEALKADAPQLWAASSRQYPVHVFFGRQGRDRSGFP